MLGAHDDRATIEVGSPANRAQLVKVEGRWKIDIPEYPRELKPSTRVN